jgi:hypothetical protein
MGTLSVNSRAMRLMFPEKVESYAFLFLSSRKAIAHPKALERYIFVRN